MVNKMVELKSYVTQQTNEQFFIEVSDSEYEFLLSLIRVSRQPEWLNRKRYIVVGREALFVSIDNMYLFPIVRKGE